MKQHKHVIIRAIVRNPINDVMWANHFMSQLISAIDMKVLIPPNSVYCEEPGNEGVTSFAVITTSHIAMHIWPTDRVVQLDVYSCKDFNPSKVCELVDNFMSVEDISSALILRDEEVVATKLEIK